MTLIDWFALLHPVLVILFVYPVVGATIRLGILVRERRLGITKQLALVPREHADHGRWLTASVVVAVLIALVYSFRSKFLAAAEGPSGGELRLASLLLAASGTLVALVALLRVKPGGSAGQLCLALLGRAAGAGLPSGDLEGVR